MSDEKIPSAFATKEELRDFVEENSFEYVKSGFKFIQAHKGLRPETLHMLLGTSGSGKSSLLKKIILDTAESVTGDVLLWQSEEEVEDFKTAIAQSYPKPDVAKKIKIISELELDSKYTQNQRTLLDYFEFVVKTLKPHAIFFDNITTSLMYMGLFPSDQDKVAWRLKRIVKDSGAPCVIVAHTGAGISDASPRLIEDTDIRGSKTITNLMPYLWIFQNFQINDTYFPTLRIRKHRKHQIDERLFLLKYSKTKKIYVNDVPLNFEDFKKAFKKRNQL